MNTDDLKLLGLISLLRHEIEINKDELTCEQDGSKYEIMPVEVMTRILDGVEAGMIQKRSSDVAKKPLKLACEMCENCHRYYIEPGCRDAERRDKNVNECSGYEPLYD